MSGRRALAALADAFHGAPPAESGWTALLETANQALVTPSLHQALAAAGLADRIPAEAAGFFALIDDRNAERNLRLRNAMSAAVEALNGAGVTPVLLKGMAVWATCRPQADRFPRMMSDVDLLVRPDEAEDAVQALLAHGFQLLRRAPDDSPHVAAELWREGDVGPLDLHVRPPGAPSLTGLFDPTADTLATAWPGAVRAPSPAHQIYLTCLHDMLHDGGFWRGGFDVRHLCDIAELTRGSQVVDWAVLEGLLRTRLVRNAVHSQLVAAHRIAGATVPPAVLRRSLPRLHYRRHAIQCAYPRLYFPLAMAGVALEAFNLGQHRAALKAQARLGDRFARVRRLARPDKVRPLPNRL